MGKQSVEGLVHRCSKLPGPGKVRVTYINGIRTGEQDCRAHAELISDFFAAPCYALWNKTAVSHISNLLRICVADAGPAMEFNLKYANSSVTQRAKSAATQTPCCANLRGKMFVQNQLLHATMLCGSIDRTEIVKDGKLHLLADSGVGACRAPGQTYRKQRAKSSFQQTRRRCYSLRIICRIISRQLGVMVCSCTLLTAKAR